MTNNLLVNTEKEFLKEVKEKSLCFYISWLRNNSNEKNKGIKGSLEAKIRWWQKWMDRCVDECWRSFKIFVPLSNISLCSACVLCKRSSRWGVNKPESSWKAKTGMTLSLIWLPFSLLLISLDFIKTRVSDINLAIWSQNSKNATIHRSSIRNIFKTSLFDYIQVDLSLHFQSEYDLIYISN